MVIIVVVVVVVEVVVVDFIVFLKSNKTVGRIRCSAGSHVHKYLYVVVDKLVL